jgi:hypothetical protein
VLGGTLGAGILVLGSVLVGGGLAQLAKEAAITAAWEVLVAGRKTPEKLIGDAGEAAAKAFLRFALEHGGQGGGHWIDANEVARDFQLIDLIGPDGTPSVKTYGVLSKRPDSEAISRYRKDFMKFFDQGTVDKAAHQFHSVRGPIQAKGAWPRALSPDATVQEIARFMKERGTLAIPDDHVDRVRRAVGRHMNQNRARYGLTGLSEQEVGARIQAATFRVQSAGVTSRDLKQAVDVARRLVEARSKVTRGRSDFAPPP